MRISLVEALCPFVFHRPRRASLFFASNQDAFDAGKDRHRPLSIGLNSADCENVIPRDLISAFQFSAFRLFRKRVPDRGMISNLSTLTFSLSTLHCTWPITGR